MKQSLFTEITKNEYILKIKNTSRWWWSWWYYMNTIFLDQNLWIFFLTVVTTHKVYFWGKNVTYFFMIACVLSYFISYLVGNSFYVFCLQKKKIKENFSWVILTIGLNFEYYFNILSNNSSCNKIKLMRISWFLI